MSIGKAQRRLCGELVAAIELPAPAEPTALYAALCDGMSRRRGRPVQYRMASFPPGTASGLWLDMADRDLVVIEERTAPDHQLVILGHELWHMKAGHCSHHVEGAAVAARLLSDEADLRATVLKVRAAVAARLLSDEADLRATVLKVAARTRFDQAQENEAESFGLLLSSKCRPWLAGSSARGPVRRDVLAGRIEAALGYRGPQG
ncbi:toxin-antitoxin system, toxin component [Streptomyces sp. A3M-1-3]|uniref:toxin-antitoxin system, toxin component n=1 Tax=Streptomyces sp. A3M-1-3 TaxID=2962044 RepID=UPI0020B7A762|nr:toxin-antitoxin system, toxin component [Streptomyces sp. A3M-1-3]MCP3818364.1 toxin-antitoxin system, toxin component [Streptomyces sp. A3M-1-3]